MTKIELEYVQRFKDRHGKVRYYFRRPGFKLVSLPGLPGSAEFMDVYTAALGAEPASLGEAKTRPGSIRALIVAYYQSADWQALDPVTHRNYRSVLEPFCERVGANGMKYGDLPARGVQVRHVYKLLDLMGDKPGAARNTIKRLRMVWAFGMPRGFVVTNPFKEVKLPKEGSGFRPWTESDIEKYEAFWPEGSRERLALYLLLYTLVRRSDVVGLGRQHRRAMTLKNSETGEVRKVDALYFTQIKGSRKKGAEPTDLVIPLHPQLKAVLDALPATNLTYLMTEFGKPFSAAGFTNWFSDSARKAGLPPGSSPHGLRKAGARRLAEAGCTGLELQSVGGWKSLKDVEHYTRSASRSKMAGSAIDKLNAS
jgi:integrase